MKEQLTLTVLSQCGAQFTHDFPADAELSAVAERAQAALGHRCPGQPQLLHVRTGRRLAPAASLQEAGLRARDELLLLPPPAPPPPPPPPLTEEAADSDPEAGCGDSGGATGGANAGGGGGDSGADADALDGARFSGGCSGVNMEDIEAATSELSPRRRPQEATTATSEAPGTPSRVGAAAAGQRVSVISGQVFARSLTPTLVTLIEACQRLLCMHPDAGKLMQLVRSGSAAPAAPSPEPDPGLIRQLSEMGFPEAQAKRALALAHNSLADATDCLLAGETALAAAEAPQQPAQPPLASAESSSDGPVAEATTPSGFVEPLPVSATLDLFRQYSRAQFRPNQALRLRLLDMGFEEPGVTDALRVHNNDEAQALEMLLGAAASGQQPPPQQQQQPQAEDSLLTGLDPESPLCKALMANSTIQLALCQPVTLLAFLSILDNPLTLNSWQNQLPGFQSLIRTIASLYYEHSAGGDGPHSWIS